MKRGEDHEEYERFRKRNRVQRMGEKLGRKRGRGSGRIGENWEEE